MDLTRELIEKYQQGRCTADERTFVEQTLGIKNIIPEHHFPEQIDEQQLKSQLWSKLSQQIDDNTYQDEPRYTDQKTVSIFKRYGFYLTGIAACVLIAVGYVFTRTDKTKNPIVNQIQLSKIVVPNGQKTVVRLSDGTKITLNGGSTLEYPIAFQDSVRLVRLSGEAFFEVARDTTKPFVINADRTSIRVLGTSFNLKAYENEENRVSVLSGKVQFWINAFPEKRLILTKGENASAATILKKENGPASDYAA